MSLPPIWSKQSRVLILGTWPSPKSRAMHFYYGHPQNRFWPMMAQLTGEPVPALTDTEAKTHMILAHGLALWDTLAACEIDGASDASIRAEIPNDVPMLLKKAPIKAVICNGAAAYRMYEKYLSDACGISAVRMPSTSPANAAVSMKKLCEVWGETLLPLLQ